MENAKQHWEQIYATRSPEEVSWYQADPRSSLCLIEDTGVGRDDPLIDVGGGASTLVDRLLEAGYGRLAVLDISAAALDRARKRLGDRAQRVEWLQADITEFVAPHPFRLWHDRAVFHFLTDLADQRRYVRNLETALAPGGHLIIATFAIGGPEKCSGLPIVQYDAERLSAVLGSNFMLEETFTEVHHTPGGADQKFAFFRLRKAQE
ncbi:MAG: class I SAM-dependent methyltransferase [Gammaproteobacteria bacterium]